MRHRDWAPKCAENCRLLQFSGARQSRNMMIGLMLRPFGIPGQDWAYRYLSLPQTQSDWRSSANRAMHRPMADLLKLIWSAIIALFRSRASLEAEILTLRHQLSVLRRKSPKRLTFSNFDRLVFATLYRFAPRVVRALAIVEPETVIRWHRAGFRLVWRWKSRCRVGRPKVPLEIRQLIRDMSRANPLWGAPRIHGELLKLGIDIGQTSVAKYMARRRKPPSQGWKTFLHTMPMESHRSICLSFRRSHFGCCTAC